LRLPDGIVHLAPTFDHAPSLGCHELDSKKARRLNTADHNFTVEAFASKARSALYLNENDAQALLTSEAFLEAALQLPAAGRFWVEILEQVSDAEIGILVDEVPPARCSEISAEFAKRIMLANKRALVALKGALQ